MCLIVRKADANGITMSMLWRVVHLCGYEREFIGHLRTAKGAAATGCARKGLRHSLPLPVTPATEAWTGCARDCMTESLGCHGQMTERILSVSIREILWTGGYCVLPMMGAAPSLASHPLPIQQIWNAYFPSFFATPRM